MKKGTLIKIKITKTITLYQFDLIQKYTPFLLTEDNKPIHYTPPTTPLNIASLISELEAHKGTWLAASDIMILISEKLPDSNHIVVTRELKKQGIISEAKTIRTGKTVSRYRFIN